jgi:alpha-1,6-mannosyltransferase
VRIVQLANMYHARSGGLRTVVDTLGHGYAAAGHDRVLIIPGARRSTAHDEHGTVIVVPGTRVTGGYRMILRTAGVLRILADLDPDSVEVSDKATLAAAGPWARERGVRAVLFSHERLDAMVANRTGARSQTLEKAVGRWTRRIVAGFDDVVATSAFGERELAAAGARSIRRVPLGVDLEVFRPAPHGPAPSAAVRLVYAGRLSTEKNPAATVDAVRALRWRGVDARLDIYGSGPALAALTRRAAGLPVVFHGHVAGRGQLAARIAQADLVLAPAACETFGLAALEALACGVAVVAAAGSGAAELVTREPGGAAPGAGAAVDPTGAGLAGGVLELLAYPREQRAAAARTRAAQFPWSAAVGRMLAIHRGEAPSALPAYADTTSPTH